MNGISALSTSIKNKYIENKKVRLSRKLSGNIGIFIALLFVCAFMILPLVYAVVQAFKPIDEIFIFPPKFFVKHPTFDNFRQVFKLAGNLWVPFSRYLFNSVFISVLGTTAYIFIASMVAYPLAKGQFKGRNLLSLLIVWTMLFRGEVTAMPLYIVMTKLNLINTYFAVILPFMAHTMGVFLMKQFITSAIPNTTLEAARIDGASEYRIFFRIVMPSIKPAWMTLMILTFQNFWNGAGASTYIYKENLKELPAVLSTISAGGIARSGAGAAVSVLMMIPPILIFIYSQSSVVETMSHSGLK